MSTPETPETPVRLRTEHWYRGTSRDNFIHRSWMKRGLPDDAFSGKPMIGICNSASELTPCNQHLDQVAEHVKRGVWEAGGVPLEFPVTSLGETQIRPTAMLLRNLMAMDVEESIRGNPIDGVVLLAGCDKTTPAMVMGAASVDLPALMVSGGPMLTGRLEGRPLGSGTDVWRMSEEVRAGTLSEDEFLAAESTMTRSAGFCNPMGTASTMASMVEALGFTLPDNAAIPAARRPAQPAGPPERPADRRDGARRPAPVRGADPPGVRERHPGAVGHRRLDQRRHPPAGDRRSGRRRPDARRLRPGRLAPAAAGQPHAGGRVPDGGLLRGRRDPGGDGRAGRRAGRRRPHRHRRPDRVTAGRTAPAGTAT